MYANCHSSDLFSVYKHVNANVLQIVYYKLINKENPSVIYYI